MHDGIKKIAAFLSNGYAITLNGTWYSAYEDTLVKDYQKFMTEEKTAGMAALFSDDEAIFAAAVERILKVNKS